jgi:rabenosyn-5
VLTCRKRVLTRLASYDSLARRIRDLPSTPGEARLQRAITARAQLFLNDKMALLRGIGSFEELDERPSSSKKKSKQIKPGSSGGGGGEPDPAFEERAARLAVLLEQEKLVAGYVDDARSHRQLEDTATLQTSLDELYVFLLVCFPTLCATDTHPSQSCRDQKAQSRELTRASTRSFLSLKFILSVPFSHSIL